MGIKSAAKKVGKAIIFMKLFEEIKANKENRLKLNTMLKMKKFSHGLKTKLKSLKLKRKQKLKLKNNLFLNYFSSIFSFFIFNVF